MWKQVGSDLVDLKRIFSVGLIFFEILKKCCPNCVPRHTGVLIIIIINNIIFDHAYFIGVLRIIFYSQSVPWLKKVWKLKNLVRGHS